MMTVTDPGNDPETHRNDLARQLDDQTARLTERKRDLAEHAEELDAKKEERTAAIEELVKKNTHLTAAVTQLEERNFELDQIFYRISHDLRAPLSSIKAFFRCWRGSRCLNPSMRITATS